jgi:predicted nucleic acid-binding protein
MKYILDSSVAVKWVLVEPYSDNANLLRDDCRNGIHDLLSPDVFPFEVMHALTKAERQKRISANQGGIL